MLVGRPSEGRTSLNGTNQITLTVNRKLPSYFEGKELRSEPALSATECHLPSAVLGQRWAAKNHTGGLLKAVRLCPSVLMLHT
jgi:hypothetical protein